MEYEYPRMGIFFISDDLDESVRLCVERKMDELVEKMDNEFETWLKENGLEAAMGVIIRSVDDTNMASV